MKAVFTKLRLLICRFIFRSEFVLFDGFDDWNPAKYFSVVFSLSTVLVGAPMLFSIISYESDCHNRTLLNRSLLKPTLIS